MVSGSGPNPLGEQALPLMNVTCTAKHFGPELARFISMPNIFTTPASTCATARNHDGMVSHMEAAQLGIAANLGLLRGPGDGWNGSAEVFRG